MASYPDPGAGTGTETTPVSSPCTTFCANTCEDCKQLINLLTEQITNGSSLPPVDKLKKFCTSVWEVRVPEPTNGTGTVFHEQPSQDHSQDGGKGEVGGREQTLDEFQIIKAAVLGLVTFIILLSICKMVFQLFVRYSAKADDRGH